MMSPRFTSVAAAGPSSAPVRREYVATSGIAMQDRLDLARDRVGLGRARCPAGRK